jgi:hypothetical protein
LAAIFKSTIPMRSSFLPLATSCLIILSSLGSAFADKYSDFYASYQKAEKDHDYETITKMTLPADLDIFKQKAMEAYKRAKTELVEKNETRSLTVTTFENLDQLEKMKPEDVYLTFRRRLAPPEDEPRVEYKYVGFRDLGDVVALDVTFQPEDGGAEKKGFIYVSEADGKIFLRLPDSIFKDL